ncbi:hypothetical protein FKP32DRAFT_1710577 [Trametes sanguinea]|nr:hypothetical protein FKP32DRAFT_1710577 [Trametes sanguinea]
MAPTCRGQKLCAVEMSGRPSEVQGARTTRAANRPAMPLRGCWTTWRRRDRDCWLGGAWRTSSLEANHARATHARVFLSAFIHSQALPGVGSSQTLESLPSPPRIQAQRSPSLHLAYRLYCFPEMHKGYVLRRATTGCKLHTGHSDRAHTFQASVLDTTGPVQARSAPQLAQYATNRRRPQPRL